MPVSHCDMDITSNSLRALVGVVEPYGFVEAGGTSVAVSRRGAGTPVLCLHAIGHGGRDFDALTDRIVGCDFEVVCVDWPGQGRSPPDATGRAASAQRYAEILVDLVARLSFGVTKPMVVGNSIGGAAAIVAAGHHPELFRALVLSNPGGLAPVDAFVRTFCRAFSAVFSAGDRGASWYPGFFRLYYRMVLQRGPARAQRRRIIASCREIASPLSDAWASFADTSSDIRGTLQDLRTPILFAWASGDSIVSWSRSRAAVLGSGAKVQHFRGGHSPFLEDPNRYAAAFLDFANSLGEA